MNRETERGRLRLPSTAVLKRQNSNTMIDVRGVPGLLWFGEGAGPSPEVSLTDRAAGLYAGALGISAFVAMSDKFVMKPSVLPVVLLFYGAYLCYHGRSGGFWIGLLYGLLVMAASVYAAANLPKAWDSLENGVMTLATILPFLVLAVYCGYRLYYGRGPNALFVDPSLIEERSRAGEEPSAQPNLEVLATSVPSRAERSVVDELESLAGLKNEGALTEEEFVKAKGKLLGRRSDADL